MNNAPDSPWTPDPQLLAAFFDGELEGRGDLADLRARLEGWLEAHPQAADEGTKHQQLHKLWLETAPAEPSAATWTQTLDRIDAKRQQPITIPASKRPWLTVGIVAASIALFVGLLFGALRSMLPTAVKNDPLVVAPKVRPAAEPEVFPVATADEVTIRLIEGADIGTLVVGELPVSGPLELAAPGEVFVFHATGADVHQQGSRPPMIWARLETD
jgi:anti-sigma factor RsiW